MIPRTLPLLSLVATVLTIAPCAFALPKDPAVQAGDETVTEEAARARYAEGVRLYTKHRYEEARAAFLQAIALKRRPAAVLMLAQSALKAGRWLEAARNFDAYVEEAPEMTPKVKQIVTEGRYEARSHLGRVRFDVPEGAEVTIDGERVPSVETPIDVMPGEHTVVITHRDDKKLQTFEALPGVTVEIKPSFTPKAIIPTSEPRGRPAAPREATPDVERHQTPGILSPPATKWPMYIAGAIGLGGLAAAAIYGGLRANASHAVEVSKEAITRDKGLKDDQSIQNKEPTVCNTDPKGLGSRLEDTCLTLRNNQELAKSYEQTFGLALLVGVSGTVIALGWFFFSAKEGADKPTESARVIVPWIGKGVGGAALEGRF